MDGEATVMKARSVREIPIGSKKRGFVEILYGRCYTLYARG